ncbi:MAG: putative signal transduction protein with domain [Clostridiales bacterium]|nr:putative signal transduction protein with domain [Clostridiales bacterium]
MQVKDIMSANVLTVKKDTTIEEIAHTLANNDIGGVPVIDDSGKVIGIVTQKDMLYKDVEPRFPAMVEILGSLIFLKGARQHNEELKKIVSTKVEDIMSSIVYTVDEDSSVEEAAQIMVERDIGRIPVTRAGKLTGIVSRTDVIKYIAKRLE